MYLILNSDSTNHLLILILSESQKPGDIKISPAYLVIGYIMLIIDLLFSEYEIDKRYYLLKRKIKN